MKTIGCVMLALSLVLILATIRLASAHGDHDWIRAHGLRNPVTGEHCCGEDDCAPIPAADVEPLHGGGWLIMSTGERIPERETLQSRDGRFWRCWKPDGSRRCFFAPPGTS